MATFKKLQRQSQPNFRRTVHRKITTAEDIADTMASFDATRPNAYADAAVTATKTIDMTDHPAIRAVSINTISLAVMSPLNQSIEM